MKQMDRPLLTYREKTEERDEDERTTRRSQTPISAIVIDLGSRQ